MLFHSAALFADMVFAYRRLGLARHKCGGQEMHIKFWLEKPNKQKSPDI